MGEYPKGMEFTESLHTNIVQSVIKQVTYYNTVLDPQFSLFASKISLIKIENGIHVAHLHKILWCTATRVSMDLWPG